MRTSILCLMLFLNILEMLLCRSKFYSKYRYFLKLYGKDELIKYRQYSKDLFIYGAQTIIIFYIPILAYLILNKNILLIIILFLEFFVQLYIRTFFMHGYIVGKFSNLIEAISNNLQIVMGYLLIYYV